MPDARIATAADYADAMMTARRAKHWLFFLLLLMLLIQLGAFLVAKFTNAIFNDAEPGAAITMTTRPTTNGAEVVIEPNRTAPARQFVHNVLRYVITGVAFLAICLAILQSIVLLLLVNIMLVGRLIGVARVTSAYIWSVLLALLLFPWQAFLDPYTWKPPGVLYTWEEFAAQAHFSDLALFPSILRWSRFLVFPLVALIILFVVQIKSNRGLRQALGEAPAVHGMGEPNITM